MMVVTISCSDSTTSSEPVQLETVSAHQLFAEREANATRFDDKYKGKRFNVTGTVSKIEGGKVYLCAGEIAFGTCFEEIALEDLPRETQASLNKGQRITAACKVGNFIIMTMFMEDCGPPNS